MLWVQQESINDIKVMITQLLTNWKESLKGPKPNTSSSGSEGKEKQGESSSSKKTESENNPNSKPPKSSSEEEDGSENGARHPKSMNELEKRLDTRRRGIVRPYSVEWDVAPYPPNFKVLTLYTFNGKG